MSWGSAPEQWLPAFMNEATAPSLIRRSRREDPTLICYGLIAFLLLGIAPQAHAQWAVIDVQALVQLMQQVQTLNQTLTTARGQLAQAQQEFQSITRQSGNAEPAVRHGPKLPAYEHRTNSHRRSRRSIQDTPAFPSAMQSALKANAVLTPQQLALAAAGCTGADLGVAINRCTAAGHHEQRAHKLQQPLRRDPAADQYHR